jgi:hypothetical protein
MDHNDFDFCEDLITPFYHFLKQFNISTREPKSMYRHLKIPPEYFKIPRAYKQSTVQMGWACFCIPMSNTMDPQNPSQVDPTASAVSHLDGPHSDNELEFYD